MRIHRLRSLIPALSLAAALPVLPAVSFAGVAIGVSITVAPPVLPVYVQPPLPAPGYIWTPGYWAWGDDGYFWVPGTWVLPPTPGLLWTPGYWGWGGGLYLWHAGYWGPHVGFYGGVNYGFGYGGVGFEGGYWRGGAFFYNRAVCNVGAVHVTNFYNRTVINNVNVTRVSFNGGAGGIHARPTAHELSAEHERHFEPTSMQRDHEHVAAGNRDLRAAVNHGRPAIAATSRPAQFSGRGVVAARGSGPHGGAAREVMRNEGPRGSGGGGPVRADRPPGAHSPAYPVRPAGTRNDMRAGGYPGRPGGTAPHAGPHPGGAAPRPGPQFNRGVPGPGPRFGGAAPGGGPRPGGAAAPHPGAGAPGGGRPQGQGAPHPQQGGGGHRPEGRWR